MNRVLFIAIGNRLRGDDGVAHAVIENLGSSPDLDSCSVLQLTPEVAADIAGYSEAIFIDADIHACGLKIEPVDESPAAAMLTHVSTPSEIVLLSRKLFGFSGHAFLCRIPACDFSPEEQLSPRTKAYVDQAVEQLKTFLVERV